MNNDPTDNPKPEGKGQYLDVRGLVKTFGHSRGFFFRMIKEGKLKTAKRPGGKHRVRAEDARGLVRQHVQAAAAARERKARGTGHLIRRKSNV